MPKVSFVLPAFKRKYLYESIESILAQSYQDFELIVVDDASPENLKEVVDQFSDIRLSYHRNEHNLGGKSLVDAWTHAIGFAQGEFCVMASDDDIYHRDYLKEMVRLSEKYPNVDVFHCRMALINVAGDIFNYGDCRAEFESCLDLLYFRGVKRYWQAFPEFMFRIKALQDIGGFVTFPVAYFSDDATFFSLALKNGIVFSNSILFYFRFSGINISTRRDNVLEKVDAVIKFMKWYPSFLEKILTENKEEEAYKKFISHALYETSCKVLFYEVSRGTLRDICQVLKTLDMPNKVIKNSIIKHYLKRKIDAFIHLITFNRL